MKRNESELSQTSSPEASTVRRLASTVVSPTWAVLPMSALGQSDRGLIGPIGATEDRPLAQLTRNKRREATNHTSDGNLPLPIRADAPCVVSHGPVALQARFVRPTAAEVGTVPGSGGIAWND